MTCPSDYPGSQKIRQASRCLASRNLIVVAQGMPGFLNHEVRDTNLDLPSKTVLNKIKRLACLILGNTHKQTYDHTCIQAVGCHEPDPRLEPMDARMACISWLLPLA